MGNSHAVPSRSRVLALAIGALAAVGVLAVAIGWETAPHAEATLHPSGIEADPQLIRLLASEGQEYELELSTPRGFGSEMMIDLSTLRSFGAYRDFEVWQAMNAFGSRCLIAVHRATLDVVERECVPEGADLFIDTMSHGLSGGERLRFVLRQDVVDAYLLTPEGVG